MNITVLFFASAREAAGNVAEARLAVAADCDTAALRQLLAARYPGLAELVRDEDSVTLALNEEYVAPDQVLPLREGDVVALIPPISGG